MNRVALLFLSVIMTTVTYSSADDMPHLGRGINLGNKLESPREKKWGSLEDWNFTKAKAAGFDSVRLPIRWYPYAAKTSPYTIEETFFKTVENAVGNALKNDLAIIINLHHYEPMYEHPEKEKPRFLAMWRQIATRFKDLPNDKVVFEILNEPRGKLTPELWNTYLAEALKVIRKSNPDRYVMIGTALFGGVQGMPKLKLPKDDKLMFTVHYYLPFKFTHQGASWSPGTDKWIGTRWKGTKKEKLAITNTLDKIVKWSKANNNVHVNIGEFGVYQKHSKPEDQFRWAECVARESEKRGFSWHYWEFNSGFGVHGPKEKDGFKPLLKALIPTQPTPLKRRK